MSSDAERDHALEDYKKALLDSREWEAKLKALRMEIKGLQKDFELSEDNIKALQSVGQIIGEVLKQLDDERCEFNVWLADLDIIRMLTCFNSHRESIIRTAIRCRLQEQG